jgi:hypothetical protein
MTRTACVLLLLVFGVLGSGCSGVQVDPVTADGPVQQPDSFDHRPFTEILDTYVDDGWVDYEGLKASGALQPYLQTLAETDPSRLSEQERLAFWINVYNALALKLIADNYPTKSILRLTPVGGIGTSVIIPKVNTPFKVDVAEVGGTVRSLDEVEHDIVRLRFDEPRIHFAIVCAAVSCPPLRSEAYVAERLDAQLDEQARIFLTDPQKNQIPAGDGTIRLSKIFKWFSDDFKSSDQGVQQYLAPYFDGAVRDSLAAGQYRVEYMDYDWTLNDQALHDEVTSDTAPATSR